MKRDVQITVVGKVWNTSRGKILALNECLDEYFKAVSFFLTFNSASKTYLQRNGYEEARERFNLGSALIQTARDKAVEMLKSFEKNKRGDSVLKPKKISIRFDERNYEFSKTKNVLTPYWLTLSLSKGKRVSLPIVFGERQKQRIEEMLRGEWKLTTVEMVKRGGEWFAHFVLKKTVEVSDEPETVIGIDLGERNLVVAVALSRNNPEKPMKGRFWRGSEIKRIRGLYAHIRRKLQKKHRIGKVKELRGKERRKVNQQLHIIANEIIEYAKQFPKPAIVMENLKGIRENFNRSKNLNKRFHTLPFRKLQTFIEYKALLEGINVIYLSKRETKNTSRTCHRCGCVTQVEGRMFKCPNCGMEYDRDLNAAINIARRVMSSARWGFCEQPEPANVSEGEKPRANAGSRLLRRQFASNLRDRRQLTSSDILHSQELAKWEVERIRRGQRAIIRKIRFAHKNIIIDGTLYEAEVKRWTPNYAIYRRTKSFISIEEAKKYCEELGIDRNEICYIIFLKKPRKVSFKWL